MKYTKKQLQDAMKKYYKNMRENPEQYEMNPEFNDEQALDSVDELLSYVE